MSIVRCDRHSRFFDTDKVEECPLCLNEATEDEYQALVANEEAVAAAMITSL